MRIDNSGITTGKRDQVFTQGEKVMVRRLGDGNEYRAKIAGIAVDDVVKIMIIEIVDRFDRVDSGYPYTHVSMPEVCIDKEPW